MIILQLNLMPPIKVVVAKTKPSKQPARPAPAPHSYDNWRVENLPLDFKQILHISDIHIRPLQRHDEFQLIFDNTVTQIKTLSATTNTITVITGDIFDSKTIFRPETFKICRDFLKAVTHVTPLVIIAGNHDMIESNITRLDSITPIADDIPNLYYLKYSGLYTCANNVTFVVSSLYNKVFIRHNDIVDSPFYNNKMDYVALYHGALTGANTDGGYMITEDADAEQTSRYRTLNDFDGYKAVLLGDIHKHQVFKTCTGNVAYAGSLIQQNHGESRDGHGILVWSLTEYTCRLHPVYNKYGFVDIHCFDGDWVNRKIDLPEHCYARLIIKNSTETQVELIRNELKTRVTNLTITKQQCINDNLKECEIPPDIKRHEDELEIIKEQSNNNNFSTEKLVLLHQGYQTIVGNDSHNKGMSTAVWRPVLLEFMNMFGYSNNICNKIIFQRGITSISADNARGKTSIVNVILFSIFGRTPLKSGNSFTCDIVNSKHDTGYVKILLNHGGVYYLIERHTKPNKLNKTNKSNKSPEVSESIVIQNINRYDFTCIIWESNINGDKIKNCTELRKNNNDTFINELFGDMDDFSLANLLNNESSTNLLDMTPGDQIKKLKKLFKLEVYDTYRELNKAAIDKMETDINILKNKTQALRSVLTDNITEATLKDMTKQLDNNEMIYTDMKTSQEQIIKDKLQLEASYKVTRDEILPVNMKLIHPYIDTGIKLVEAEIETCKDVVSTGENTDLIKYKITETEGHISRIKSCNYNNNDLPELEELLTEECNILQSLEKYNVIESNITADKLRLIIGRKEEAVDNLQHQLDAIGNIECAYVDDIQHLKSQIIHLTSNLDTVNDKIALLHSSDIYRNPPIYTVHEDVPLKLLACRSEQNRIKLENQTLNKRNMKYYGLISVEQLNILYGELHLVPNVKYNINIKAMSKAEKDLLKTQIELKLVKDNIIVDTKEYVQLLEDCPIIDAKMKDTYDLNPDIEYMLIEERIINRVIGHLSNEQDKTIIIDQIQKLQSHIHLKEQEISKTAEHMEINKKIDANYVIQADIDAIKHILNEAKIQELNNKAEELEVLVTQHDLYNRYSNIILQLEELELERRTHINNASLLGKISSAELYLRKSALEVKLNTVQLELNEHHDKLDYCQLKENLKSVQIDIKRHREHKTALTDLSHYQASARKLTKQLKCQAEYEKFIALKEILLQFQAYLKNQSLQDIIQEIKINIALLDIDIKKQNLDLCKLDLIIRDLGKNIAVYTDHLRTQNDIKCKLKEAVDALVRLEEDIIPYNQYNILMGVKGITSKLLFIKIKSIELYINSIIETFTKYKIHIIYDDKKQTISIITENIDTHNYLSTERLSGYEKLMLQIAFKRALNKFSYNSKSSIMIIDESLGCIDDNNFFTILPNVMNMITQDYSTCLAISQKDVSHICDNVITIRNQNGTSVICQ